MSDMSDMNDPRLERYFREAESWAQDRQKQIDRSARLAWILAALAAFVAIVEALALCLLIPLKREVPYTLLVDRQTGFVQALRPLDADTVSPDSALTRSFLVQYVIAREGFDIDSLQSDYRKVALWSGGEARNRYIALMNAGNPNSPLANLPRQTTIDVQIRSVSSLSPKTAMVRFSTTRIDPGGRTQPAQHWAAVIAYQFSRAQMSEADRLTNPLGFQVTRYRRNAETLVEQPDEPTATQGQPGTNPPLSSVRP